MYVYLNLYLIKYFRDIKFNNKSKRKKDQRFFSYKMRKRVSLNSINKWKT